MNRFVWIEVEAIQSSKVLLKLFKQNINVLEVQYLKHGLRFKMDASQVKKLKKIVGYNFRKVHESGIYALFDYIKKKWLIFSGLILFCCFLFLFSHIIVSVQVIHSNKEIRDLVSKALDQYGIRELTLKKDFQEISKIKEQILKDYPNQLEWLEIEVSGMKYVVRIEERIITVPEPKKERCHLIATKSGIVKKMIFSVGDSKVTLNDFVKEGDILVSGELIANEVITGLVCAEGEVYGEVWYTTNVSIPLNYEEKQETGKVRYNLEWSKGSVNHLIFRPRLKNYVEEKKQLFSFFEIPISFVKQKEVTVTPKVYNEQTALEKALQLVDEKFKMKLGEKEEILSKKVLKKKVNNSTMEVEVFVSVIEQISRQVEFSENKEEG